jgi:hypothetical protein
MMISVFSIFQPLKVYQIHHFENQGRCLFTYYFIPLLFIVLNVKTCIFYLGKVLDSKHVFFSFSWRNDFRMKLITEMKIRNFFLKVNTTKMF